MSRGWENKSVQGMMDDHDNRPKRRERERTPEEMAFEKKRYRLELSRKGVLNDLERATNPRHKAQLEAALRHLDGQMAELLQSAQQIGTGSEERSSGDQKDANRDK
jgi:hypothetical protein